jgi:hypothetical protein
VTRAILITATIRSKADTSVGTTVWIDLRAHIALIVVGRATIRSKADTSVGTTVGRYHRTSTWIGVVAIVVVVAVPCATREAGRSEKRENRCGSEQSLVHLHFITSNNARVKHMLGDCELPSCTPR